MANIIALGKEHGYVLSVLLGSVGVHTFYMAFKVSAARKKYGVKYPNLYANKTECKDADAFNCVQRGHQNALENLAVFHALLLTAGVKYPVTASALGATYLLGRVLYMEGYASSAGPKGRYRGSLYYVGMLGLIGTVGTWAYQLLTA